MLSVFKMSSFRHMCIMHRKGMHVQSTHFAPWHNLSAPWCQMNAVIVLRITIPNPDR